jgi:class 3 adenylate cyclase/DNA-binding NarL/FixJ family response regulator
MAEEKILVVEDESSIAETLRIGLTFLGYHVPAMVDTGRQAVEQAEKIRPDLVLMDIRLKGDMDGVEAAGQIREKLGIPVVYLTAYADHATVERAKETEPFGYILKPYSIDDLRSTIEIALCRHRLNEAAQQEASANSAVAELASALLSSASLENIAHLVLARARHITASSVGFVGYVDAETGDLICPTLNKETSDVCQIGNTRTSEFEGLWGWVLEQQQALLTNAPADDPRSSETTPDGGSMRCFLAAPAMLGGTLVGIVALANADHDYAENDLSMVERLAEMYAVAVQRQRAVEALHELSQELTEEAKKRDEAKHELQMANDRLDYLLRRFVPASLAQKLIDEHNLPTLGGQRRTVTILFADVRGYTPLAEVLEPEALMALLNRHFALLGNLIKKHGGTVSRYAGDLMVAVFNAPEDQTHHALRAVRAAVEIRAALIEAGQRPPEGEEWPIAMQFGIGINTGTAIVGYLGFEDRFDFTVIGDAVNVASRLSTIAHSGEVLIGPNTFEEIRGQVRTRSLGPMQLKGKSQPIHVYEALGEVRMDHQSISRTDRA